MHIRVLAIGTKMPAWVAQGVADYQKRLPKVWRFEWVELPLGSRGKSVSVAQAIESEADAILSLIGARERVVALDVKGKFWSTEVLSTQLADWQMDGDDVTLLIGGPDGLSPRCLERANSRWSLSALTLPHPLVRILLVEQFYRAWALLTHHPYHRS